MTEAERIMLQALHDLLEMSENDMNHSLQKSEEYKLKDEPLLEAIENAKLKLLLPYIEVMNKRVEEAMNVMEGKVEKISIN